MSFFDFFSRSPKANEAIVAAIQENNVQLQAITQALNNRENLERTQKATEVVLAAIQENNIKLQGVTLALNDRENPDKIREAIISGLQTGNLEKALTETHGQLDSLNSSLKLFGSRPLSVQTFPVTDNFQFEKEKQSAAGNSAKFV